MIKKIDMYACVCDRCGKIYEDEDMGYIAWVDGGQAFESASENGWTEIGGKHYCPDCYEYDEETDEYKPKAKEDNK